MPPESDFDRLVATTWRPLLLQTFAVCGDLGVAERSLSSSYVALSSHWARLDPGQRETRLRSRAWNSALLHSHARAFQRQPGLSRPQRQVLRALGSLPVLSRKALTLAGLSELSVPQIATEIGDSHARTERHIFDGLAAMARALKVEPAQVAERLVGLGDVTRAFTAPPAEDLRRQGRRRRVLHLVGGAVLAAVLTLVTGVLTYAAPGPDPSLPALGPALSRDLLLTQPGVAQTLGPGWRVGATDDNTGGTGINSQCQQARFADPNGNKALVRRFAAPSSTLVQTVEISSSEAGSRNAYRRAVGWFSGCRTGRLQLLDAYQVTGLGDQADLMRFRTAGRRLGGFAVVLARAGSLTTWSALTVEGGVAPAPATLQALATTSIFRLCASRASGRCAIDPRARTAALPRTGEQPGMLSVADLPPIPKITQPWVGTRAQPPSVNAAATPCDQTSFGQAGAVAGMTRTFLIPGAGLPASFGLTETYGRFRNTRVAAVLLNRVHDRMATCPKRVLSAKVPVQRAGPGYRFWRVTSQVRAHRSVQFWMGLVQQGSYVAQVGFVAADGADLDRSTFAAVLVRARDRLLELGR